MDTEQQADEILDYVLTCLQLKGKISAKQHKEMINEITFLIDTT